VYLSECFWIRAPEVAKHSTKFKQGLTRSSLLILIIIIIIKMTEKHKLISGDDEGEFECKTSTFLNQVNASVSPIDNRNINHSVTRLT
jgi:hypothetical protein